MTVYERKQLLESFLERWTIDKVKNLTLEEYTGINNQDTFCQWVETKTSSLGSIRGMTSNKFGIYERKEKEKRPKNYQNDEKYSWLKSYGANRKVAFNKTKENIIKIIDSSIIGRFDLIDAIYLPDLYKWKIASLYSNERLIPIFSNKVLLKIANHFGISELKGIKKSEIQLKMVQNKPANQDIYEYSIELYNKFSPEKDKAIIDDTKKESGGTNKRTATNLKNVDTQYRTMSCSFIVEQKHNKIQEKLREKLIDQYGDENVKLEENFVDIKVIQPEFINFYEVKSSSYAKDCIKEALGQILCYSFDDKDQRPKKLFVVGQYPPNKFEKAYIDFIKKILTLEFDYLDIEIN